MRAFELIGVLVVAALLYTGVKRTIDRWVRANAALREQDETKEEAKDGKSNDG